MVLPGRLKGHGPSGGSFPILFYEPGNLGATMVPLSGVFAGVVGTIVIAVSAATWARSVIGSRPNSSSESHFDADIPPLYRITFLACAITNERSATSRWVADLRAYTLTIAGVASLAFGPVALLAAVEWRPSAPLSAGFMIMAPASSVIKCLGECPVNSLDWLRSMPSGCIDRIDLIAISISLCSALAIGALSLGSPCIVYAFSAGNRKSSPISLKLPVLFPHASSIGAVHSVLRIPCVDAAHANGLGARVVGFLLSHARPDINPFFIDVMCDL